MLERFMDFATLCILLFYSLVNYVYNQIKIRIIRKPTIPTPISEEGEEAEEAYGEEGEEAYGEEAEEAYGEEAEEACGEESEEFEFFQNNTNNNTSNQNNRTAQRQQKLTIFKPDDYWAFNAGNYNEYSIEKIYPNTMLLPHNYHLQTVKYETENTDYDYNDFNNVDGSGVHLLGNWPNNNINTPWFETCLSPMGCKVVEGTLEK